jgi:hypothetical protein
VTFRNDLPAAVNVGSCTDPTCRHVIGWFGVDRGALATVEVRSDGRTARYAVIGPPETIYGCLALSFHGRHAEVTVPLSRARGCGSGR